MDISQKILSDITVFNKYAKFIPDLGRRENWKELCLRNMGMHLRKYPHMATEIEQVYNDFVFTKKVLPSMRSMQFGGRPIELSNNRMFNCFSPDTRFITTRGTYSFDQFVDGDEVEVMTHKGNIKKAVVKNYGKQDLYEVVFKRGKATKTVHVTKNHRWILYNGSETTNLKVGDSIAGIRNKESFDFDAATPFEKLYWCYGYVFGDGSKIKDKNGEYKHTLVRLCGDDKKYLPRFEEVGFTSSTPLSAKGDPFVYTGTYLKTAPDPLKDSPELISAFVDGYLCADAYKNPNWYYNGELSKYVSIQSSDDDHIELLKTCLEASGYFITTEKNVGGTVTNFGTYRDNTTWFGLSGWVGKRIQNSWKVDSISIHPISVSDVWCLEVEDDHSFVLSGGLVTGNCAFVAIDHPAAFWESMFLLLGGSGVGFSVQFPHVAKLPAVIGPTARPRRFLVGDSIEGWADAIKVLVRAYFEGKSDPDFDYRDIRPKGAKLITSGGKAPGPEPLRICVEQLRKVLNGAVGRKLTPLECHDMMCHIADAVLSGGIRRAALISLFSMNDLDVLSCKTGAWWELNPQRGRANNSVVLERNKVTEEQFMSIWQRVQTSGCGEPGFFWTNDINVGTNPCCEISLLSMQFCNLTETDVSDIETQKELNDRCRAAAFLGTLQAGYTNFHYLRSQWIENTEKDALIGVGMTGIGSGRVLPFNLIEAAEVVKIENERVAKLIGINIAARCTTVKPSGTSSLTVGSSSGIHAWHNDYYIRRMRVGKNEALYHYMTKYFPTLIEDCVFKPHLEAVMKFPQKAPEGAIYRTEPAINLLKRVRKFNQEWVHAGYREGANHHNVSCTISIRDEEWDMVGEWCWNNKKYYNGISVLPYDTGSYPQAPFTDCTKAEFDKLAAHLFDINLDDVMEEEDNTNLTDQQACGAGGCLI